MAKRKSGNPARAAWQPLQRGTPNPVAVGRIDEVWANDLYQVTVEYLDPDVGKAGPLYVSLKRNDRMATRDWRHLQQIKNEVVGPEREAVELFPAESRLMDTSNQYHLWVMPEGERIAIGYEEGSVTTDEQAEAFNNLGGKGRQRPWQPGLTTGRNDSTPYATDEQTEAIKEVLRRVGVVP